MPELQSYINIHTHRQQEKDVISIINVNSAISFCPENRSVSIGIHPWFIKAYSIDETIYYIEKTISKKGVLAIGECGLDKLIEIPLQEQETILIKQLTIAQKYNKPVIIHCVKAFDELIKIKNQMNLKIPLIVHGFNNNKIIADKLIANGFYLSFGHALTNSKSNASKIIRTIPIEKIFFETDDADLSIKAIFEVASKYLQISLEELKQQILINFNNIFTYE